MGSGHGFRLNPALLVWLSALTVLVAACRPSIPFCGSPFARSLELKPRRHARNRHGQLYSEHQRNRAGSEFGHEVAIRREGGHADPSEGQKQGNAVCPFLRCQRPWSASG